jgi:hypothetical protein
LQPDRSLVQLQHVPILFALAARVGRKLGDWSSGMIPASGAGGREFDSRITPFLPNFKQKPKKKKIVRTGTRTQNLLLRRQAPYPLGHTDIVRIYATARCPPHELVDEPKKKVEKQGIDPCASCMLSKRSTI